MDITKLDAQSILSDEVLEEWASEADEIEKAKLLLALQDKAKLVGVKGKFDIMIAAYKRVQKFLHRKVRQIWQVTNNAN